MDIKLSPKVESSVRAAAKPQAAFKTELLTFERAQPISAKKEKTSDEENEGEAARVEPHLSSMNQRQVWREYAVLLTSGKRDANTEKVSEQ